MELIYKKASIDDIGILTETRIKVLRAANKLEDSVDMTEIKNQSYEYYKASLESEVHIAYLVFDQDQFVGAGGVSFYQVMPTYDNPTGKKAYIMNMYTHPDYRRKGIAYQTLERLILAARKRGISAVSLEATEVGRLLYEKYGFVEMKDEMKLPQA